MIHIYHFMPGRKIRLFALNRTGRAPRRRFIISAMPTWPSPRSERLGTPKIPAIRFTRGTYFGASRFTYATACQVARPPLTDRTRSPRPQRAFTSRLPAVWSPSLPLDITTTWTGLLLLAGPAPGGMAASLAAPEPDVQLARTTLFRRWFTALRELVSPDREGTTLVARSLPLFDLVEHLVGHLSGD